MISITYRCSCCDVDSEEMKTWRTSDGRTWCDEHGQLAVDLELLAMKRGQSSFRMPGPHTLAALSRKKRNNRLRHLA